MWTTLGEIAGSIIGPIVVFLIARYWKSISAKALTEARQKQEEKDLEAASVALAERDRRINNSIDTQKTLRDKWAEENKPK